MEFNLEEMLNKVIDELKTVAKTETVIGQSFKLGEFECVPVVKISMGFGSGGRSGEGGKDNTRKGGAAGAGIGLEPLGFLVTRGDEISLVSITKSKGLDAVFEKVPDLLEKIIEKRKTKEDV
jgi:uncharacterized spore protein YtfJ